MLGWGGGIRWRIHIDPKGADARVQERGNCRGSKRSGCGINREGGIVADPKGVGVGLTGKGALSRIQKGRMGD